MQILKASVEHGESASLLLIEQRAKSTSPTYDHLYIAAPPPTKVL